ncbi:MAG: prepilin-type N-terminal cleavage/methylation domain-containing protein [Alphaproteobacteria bacterium]|nr:prepilin-type N-terminal cleavage/methylation domain-containing protein [Alphaproteobacteria bacterium]
MQSNLVNMNRKAFSLVELSIVILIIGILVAGVTQVTSMWRKTKLNAARSMTTSSYVNSISGVSLWLETTRQESFPEDYSNNSTVTKWKDTNPQSSNRIDVTPSANPVLYKTGVINGLPALLFNSSSMTASNVAFGQIVSADQGSIFLVWQNLGGTSVTGSPIIMDIGSRVEGTVTRLNIHTPWNNGVTYFDFGSTCCSDSLSRTTVTAPSGHSSAPVIWSFIKTQSSAKIFFNGALQTTNNSATGRLDPNTAVTMYIMSGTLNAYMAEMIIFNKAVSDKERKLVEKYLSQKWGIKVS